MIGTKGIMIENQQDNRLLTGKAAVIYGGSGAIGSAAARVFVREGAAVFLVARTQKRLDNIAGELTAAGGKVEIAALNVFDENAVIDHASDISAKAGGIDVVLNATSAVHDQGTELSGLSLDAFMLPIDSFVRPLFIISKAVAPHLGKRRQGVILNLTAPAAKMTASGHLGHIVSCAAVEGFSRALVGELAPQNVRVLAVRPHAIIDAPEAGSYGVRAEGLSGRNFSGRVARRSGRHHDAQATAKLGRCRRDDRFSGFQSCESDDCGRRQSDCRRGGRLREDGPWPLDIWPTCAVASVPVALVLDPICISSAISDRDQTYSKHTGPRVAALRQWTTTTGFST
jgi:NADP-dependent 3-hydroxy acid dehydrogenase YdfG